MRKVTKYCLKKLVCGLLSAAFVMVSVPTCMTSLHVNAETAGNYIKNGDFESLDNDTSPDFSPNEWEYISGGWYIEKAGTAVEGNAYLVATQDSESKQTVSLPNGSYDFSGWLNPSYNVNEIKITLKSGANEASVSVKNGETAAYKTIDRFEVTTGEITIILTADVVTNFDAAAILDDLKLVKSSDNFIKNPSFENTDNGTVPDYSPNDWNTISGWYVNSDPSAIDGNHVLIATQDAETSQTISLPDGEYHFSGWLFPLDAAQAEMSITLTSGSNTQMITAKSGDGAGYQTIENFVVTGGTITITLKSTFGVQLGSPAMVDDLKLVDSSTIPVPQVTVTFDANGGTGTMTEQKIDEGKPTALKTNTYKKAKYNFTGWNTQADGTFEKQEKTDCLLNLFFAYALQAYDHLANTLQEEEEQNFAKKTYKLLSDRINSVFWDQKQGGYRISQHVEQTPELAQALAVISGVGSIHKKTLVNGLLQKNYFPYTTLSSKIFTFDALLQQPENAEAVRDEIRAVWGRMLLQGAATFWETEKGAADFENAGSLCHGWSAVPVYIYHRLKHEMDE